MLMNLKIGLNTRMPKTEKWGKLPRNVIIMLMSSVVQYNGNVIVIRRNVEIDRLVSNIMFECGIGVAKFQNIPVAKDKIKAVPKHARLFFTPSILPIPASNKTCYKTRIDIACRTVETEKRLP